MKRTKKKTHQNTDMANNSADNDIFKELQDTDLYFERHKGHPRKQQKRPRNGSIFIKESCNTCRRKPGESSHYRSATKSC